MMNDASELWQRDGWYDARGGAAVDEASDPPEPVVEPTPPPENSTPAPPAAPDW
jgi:hypothetical protein